MRSLLPKLDHYRFLPFIDAGVDMCLSSPDDLANLFDVPYYDHEQAKDHADLSSVFDGKYSPLYIPFVMYSNFVIVSNAILSNIYPLILPTVELWSIADRQQSSADRIGQIVKSMATQQLHQQMLFLLVARVCFRFHHHLGCNAEI